MDDTATWISPDAPVYEPTPMGPIENRGAIPFSWSREALLTTSARSGFMPTYTQERAAQAIPIGAAKPIVMTRPPESSGLSTPVMVGLGAVAVVALGAVLYKLRKRR